MLVSAATTPSSPLRTSAGGTEDLSALIISRPGRPPDRGSPAAPVPLTRSARGDLPDSVVAPQSVRSRARPAPRAPRYTRPAGRIPPPATRTPEALPACSGELPDRKSGG